MDQNVISELISTVGFPITCVIALAYLTTICHHIWQFMFGKEYHKHKIIKEKKEVIRYVARL